MPRAVTGSQHLRRGIDADPACRLAGATACGGALPTLEGSGERRDAGALGRSAAGLPAFVRSGVYRTWKAEPAIHASTGAHVRTWVNGVLSASLKAGHTTHPPGSVTVKELSSSGTAGITGHAIDAKGIWFFLEGFAPSYASPYDFQGTSNFCASCHTSGLDFYAGRLSNLP